MADPTSFIIDKNDANWIAVEKIINARIAERMKALETPGLDVAQTEQVRGALAELRGILSDATPAKEEAFEPVAYDQFVSDPQ